MRTLILVVIKQKYGHEATQMLVMKVVLLLKFSKLHKYIITWMSKLIEKHELGVMYVPDNRVNLGGSLVPLLRLSLMDTAYYIYFHHHTVYYFACGSCTDLDGHE
ncbi:hypothetical protein HanIR_Chr04g0199411 [Helianthus annuus]|nr:hypothetical protein HanIR_Chr04g0199411 [Helianthus annuus]